MNTGGGPKNFVVVDTSAGLCLMREPKACAAPCPRCLRARLEEAGFTLKSPLVRRSAREFHPELVAPLETEDSRCAPVVRVDLAKQQASVHTLLPVPNCPGCDVRQVRKRRSPFIPRDALRDPLLGIVSCFELQDLKGEPDFLCFRAAGLIHGQGSNPGDYAYAQSSDAESARAAQLGEAVERYAAFRPEKNWLVTARAKDLPGPTPPLKLFNGFDHDQLAMTGYRRLTRGMRLAWVEGRSLRDGHPVFVPAAAVYLRRSWNRAEPRIGALMSHGLAAHASMEEACNGALLEVYERFHLTAAWQRQSLGSALAPAILPDAVRPILERLERAKLRLYLRSLVAAPAVPVVLAAIVGDRYPWVRFGSAARRKTSEAAARSLLEACGGWQAARQNRDKTHLRRLEPLTGAAAHPAYYATPNRAVRLVDLLKRGVTAAPVTLPDEAGSGVREEVLHLAPHAVVVCITTPDCRACGLEVIKIVAPGVPLLHFGRVGTPREHAKRFGLPDISSPHPFP